jgi:CheY-like chemotaxis protein
LGLREARPPCAGHECPARSDPTQSSYGLHGPRPSLAERTVECALLSSLNFDLRFVAVALRKTVLIVEDDQDVRSLYRVSLQFAGFRVHEASDGYDALRIVDRDPPDLIVLDLALPGVPGLAVQQEIAGNGHTRHIPIVIVTGSDVPLDGNAARCVLRKPVEPHRLVQVVRECITAGSPPPAAGTL